MDTGEQWVRDDGIRDFSVQPASGSRDSPEGRVTLAQIIPSSMERCPTESEHSGKSQVVVKEPINSSRPGKWCMRSRGQLENLVKNKWTQ